MIGLIYQKPVEEKKEIRFNAELAEKSKGMNSDELKQTSLFGFMSKQESVSSSKHEQKSSLIEPEDLKKPHPSLIDEAGYESDEENFKLEEKTHKSTLPN